MLSRRTIVGSLLGGVVGFIGGWEGIALLPHVDYNKIKQEYFAYIDNVSDKDKKRNIIGKTFMYVCNDIHNDIAVKFIEF